MFVLIGVLTMLIVLIWTYAAKTYQHWTKRKVPEADLWTNIKDLLQTVFGSEDFAETWCQYYKRAKNYRYYGVYQLGAPLLMIKDIDLIKAMAVRDFDYFPNHRPMASGDADPLWDKNLFASQGERWRAMRATLSPTFTGSKMRGMFTLMNEATKKYVDYYKSGPSQFSIEFKDSFTRLANDVIASCAFGLQVDSLKEPENEFYLMGKAATNFGSLVRSIKFLIAMSAPKLAKVLKIDFFPKKVRTFFGEIISQTIKFREENNIIRPDLIHLLMEARKGRLTYEDDGSKVNDTFSMLDATQIDRNEKLRLTNISDEDITAQAALFFTGGFDSIATALSFIAHEVAVHPEIQERLRQEMLDSMEKNNGQLTYESLIKMKYLDMVVSESLRKWPIAMFTDRVCTKSYTLTKAGDEEQDLVMRPGDVTLFNIIGVHRDPQIYPEPDVFNPERFNDDNKHLITPYNYMPFGVGPRHCIAIRFALMEVKTVLTHLLVNFELYPTEKTHIPMKLAKRLTMISEGGFWLGMRIRK